MTKKKTPPPVVKVAMEHYGTGSQERVPAESIHCPNCSQEVAWREGCWYPAVHKDRETGERIRDAYDARCKNCMKSFVAEMYYVEPCPSFAMELKPFTDQPVLRVIRQAIYLADRLCVPVTFENVGHVFFLQGNESAEEVYIHYLQKHNQDKIVDGRFQVVTCEEPDTLEVASK